MVDIPTTEPEKITAGDYIQWSKTLADYPAPTWVLSYVLINSAAKITLTAAASGTDHLVTIAAATSAAYTAGTYKYQAYVTSGAQRYSLDPGEIVINPNYSAATTLDTRTDNKKTLDAIVAVILGRASQDQQEYTIGNRSLKRTPMADLLTLRREYEALVRKEEDDASVAAGGVRKNKILVRF